MRFAAIAGLIHSMLPMAQRQMNLNDHEPFPHPKIDQLGSSAGLTQARRNAAVSTPPVPTPVSAIYMGGRWFERAV